MLVKEVEVKKLELSREVAIDFGMECLFATDRGDLLGREFCSKVKEYAEKIDKFHAKQEISKAQPQAE